MSIKGWRRQGAAMVLLCAFCVRCETIRADEFECEEAMQRLDECCGEVPALNCNQRVVMACESPQTTELPVSLAVSASKCIRSASCASLKKAGLCGAELDRLKMSCALLSNRGQASGLSADR